MNATQRGAFLRWIESFGAEASAIPGDRRQVGPPERAFHCSVPGQGLVAPKPGAFFQFASIRVLRWAETPVRGRSLGYRECPFEKNLIFCLPFSEKITYNGRQHEFALGARRKNGAKDEFEKTEKNPQTIRKKFP
jgi:hypothetical protein